MGILVREAVKMSPQSAFFRPMNTRSKILIDIKHPAQLNLFRGLAKELVEDNYDVTVCYLERGKLPKIIQAEYAGFNTIPVGSSKGTKWSIFWNGNVKRTLTFLKLIARHRYDICISASSVPLALACKISGTPIIQFYDDPERTRINQMNAMLSNQIFFPPIVATDEKVSVFNCLKEWSYLSPARFRANPEVPAKLGLAAHEYVFVREVSNKSFNYYNQDDAIINRLASQINPNVKVVISVEDKSLVDKYPSNWMVLQEPVEDIHSLIYYSKLVVSSGDSMAREGAMLGVPSIYCGIRSMKANKVLMDLGMLQHLPQQQMVDPANRLITSDFDKENQHKFRSQLLLTWDDMIDFMKSQINIYKKKLSLNYKYE